jgi:hypothetical protein
MVRIHALSEILSWYSGSLHTDRRDHQPLAPWLFLQLGDLVQGTTPRWLEPVHPLVGDNLVE